MREDVCWYYERGWPFAAIEVVMENGRARIERTRVVTRRTLGARGFRALARPRLRVSGADHLEKSQPHPHHGPARHSGPLSRVVRRRLLDGAESAAADADLLLRLRRGVEGEVRQRSQPLRIRSLLPGRHAAVAGVQRSRRARALGDAGASEFRQEAGLRGGDPALQSGGFGTGQRDLRAAAVFHRLSDSARNPAACRWSGCRC